MMDLRFGAASQTRTPALRLFANGQIIAGALSADICSAGYHSADRFRATLAASAQAKSWFAAQTDITLDLQVGLDGVWTNLVHGLVDNVSIEPITGLLHLDGRDLTAALIAAATSETFANHTASDIATLLAARHDLVASVTPTESPVGRYYQSEHDRSSLNQFARLTTEWDLLVFLAQQEGFDAYVAGTTLNFHPSGSQAASWGLVPADCVDLRLERALTLATDISVTVRSWNSRQQSACVQTAKSLNASRTGAESKYVYVRPNLSPDQALQFAQTMLADLARHERVVSATIPGEVTMTPRDTLVLTGTGTAFDQSYRITRINRMISAENGFVQHVQARSASAATA